MENVSMDDVIKATAVKARYMVPDNIVKELQQEVKNYRSQCDKLFISVIYKSS
jgi:hypothetical protein